MVATGPPSDADRSDYPLTQIRWAPGAAGKALTTALLLGTNNTVEARPGETDGADVVVVVGRDWDALDAPAKKPPDPNAPTATTGSGSIAPSTVATTTTTVPPDVTAAVPVDPKTGGPLVGCP